MMVSCESQYNVNSRENSQPNTIYEYVFSEESQRSVIFGPKVSHSENKTYESLVSIERLHDGSYSVFVANKLVNDYARSYQYTYDSLSDFRKDLDIIVDALQNGVTTIKLNIRSNYEGDAEIGVIHHDDCDMVHLKYGSLNFIFPLSFLK